MYCIPHTDFIPFHGDGVQCIPKMGMLSVSWEITSFWYEMLTFVLTVYLLI